MIFLKHKSDQNIYFRDNILTFRAKKSNTFTTENNAQTFPKQLQKNFAKGEKITFLRAKIGRLFFIWKGPQLGLLGLLGPEPPWPVIFRSKFPHQALNWSCMAKMTPQNRQNEQNFDQKFRFSGSFMNL